MTDLSVKRIADGRGPVPAAVVSLRPFKIRPALAFRQGGAGPRELVQPADSADDVADLSAAGAAARKERLRAAICGQRQSLLNLARYLCSANPADVEDFVQETLLRALDRIDSLRKEERLEPWLKSILVNIVRDRYRRKEPGVELCFEVPSQMATPEHIAEHGEFFVQTRAAIQQLTPRLRQVVGLVCVAEFSYAEAAAVLDVPIGTIMSRLSRAREQLQPMLRKHRIGPSSLPAGMSHLASAWSWEGGMPVSELRTAFC